MKNRLYKKKKNGKFWCRHVWNVIGKYGPYWDLHTGLKVLCRCSICDRFYYFPNHKVKEVPDQLIDSTIVYL